MTTNRFTLRQVGAGDGSWFLSFATDPLIKRFVIQGQVDQSTANRIFSDWQTRYALLVISGKSSADAIGMCGAHRTSREMFIGIFLDKRRQGVAREVLPAVIPYFKSQLGTTILRAKVYLDNAPSLALCESFGFIKVKKTKEVQYFKI